MHDSTQFPDADPDPDPITDGGPDASWSGPDVRPATTVPPRETPAAVCAHCSRPFRTARQHALHVGETHDDDLTADERAAYDEAHEAEADELFVFHLKVFLALGAVYAGFVVAAVSAFSVTG
jgi:hypothetical protein